MAERIYTVTTRLENTDELEQYFGAYIKAYNTVYRFMWRKMSAPDFKNRFRSDSEFVSYVCARFGMMKRTANSLRYDIRGRIAALKEHKRFLIKELGYRQQKYRKEIAEMQKLVSRLKQLAAQNLLTDTQLKSYRKCKRELYVMRNKMNEITQRRNRIRFELKMNIYKLGFGERKMFRKQYHLKENGYRSHKSWYKDYVRQRDKNIFYLGSKDESCGNQMFQMKYEEECDDFVLKIRKEYSYEENGRYLVVSHVDFRYMHETIKNIIIANMERKSDSRPMTYRIIRKEKKWYLQVIFSLDAGKIVTRSDYGTIGLDFNRGFIQTAETDRKGNLIRLEIFPVTVNGRRGRRLNDMREVVNRITDMALESGKDIVAEELEFARKKARLIDKNDMRSKAARKMLNILEYRRYLDVLNNACARKGVYCRVVNPAYTSSTGKEKYCEKKKLTIHQAAAYVIARKGQGYAG